MITGSRQGYILTSRLREGILLSRSAVLTPGGGGGETANTDGVRCINYVMLFYINLSQRHVLCQIVL